MGPKQCGSLQGESHRWDGFGPSSGSSASEPAAQDNDNRKRDLKDMFKRNLPFKSNEIWILELDYIEFHMILPSSILSGGCWLVQTHRFSQYRCGAKSGRGVPRESANNFQVMGESHVVSPCSWMVYFVIFCGKFHPNHDDSWGTPWLRKPPFGNRNVKYRLGYTVITII